MTDLLNSTVCRRNYKSYKTECLYFIAFLVSSVCLVLYRTSQTGERITLDICNEFENQGALWFWSNLDLNSHLVNNKSFCIICKGKKKKHPNSMPSTLICELKVMEELKCC